VVRRTFPGSTTTHWGLLKQPDKQKTTTLWVEEMSAGEGRFSLAFEFRSEFKSAASRCRVKLAFSHRKVLLPKTWAVYVPLVVIKGDSQTVLKVKIPITNYYEKHPGFEVHS